MPALVRCGLALHKPQQHELCSSRDLSFESGAARVSVVIPVEEQEGEGGNEQEREDEDAEVTRVLRGRVEVRIAAHEVLGRLLRLSVQHVDLARLLLHLRAQR